MREREVDIERVRERENVCVQTFKCPWFQKRRREMGAEEKRTGKGKMRHCPNTR